MWLSCTHVLIVKYVNECQGGTRGVRGKLVYGGTPLKTSGLDQHAYLFLTEMCLKKSWSRTVQVQEKNVQGGHLAHFVISMSRHSSLKGVVLSGFHCTSMWVLQRASVLYNSTPTCLSPKEDTTWVHHFSFALLSQGGCWFICWKPEDLGSAQSVPAWRDQPHDSHWNPLEGLLRLWKCELIRQMNCKAIYI